MKNTFQRFSAVPALIVLCLGVFLSGGCRNEARDTRETLQIFGTLVEIVIRDTDEDTAQKAVSAITSDFRRMHAGWHAWKPGELTDLNTAFSKGRAMTVSPFLLPLIRQAKEFHRQSDGLFNPAIGGLIAAWGFHADDLPSGDIPSRDSIRALVSQAPSMEEVVLEGSLVSSRNASVRLDFGGFAKGTALDIAAARLKSFGIDNAILNAGGDLSVLGNPEGRRWRAGIRHPLHFGLVASVELNAGEALCTSGNYERYREYEGIRYAHIIDPRTGMPVSHIVSASVIHESAALADAAATALSIAGPSDWARIARRMKVRYALLIDRDGTVYLTPDMKARVEFASGKPVKIVVSAPPAPTGP